MSERFPPPRHVRITGTGPTATVEIDGNRVDGIRSYMIEHRAGEFPHITIVLAPRALTVDGLAFVKWEAP